MARVAQPDLLAHIGASPQPVPDRRHGARPPKRAHTHTLDEIDRLDRGIFS